ncbi:MAG: hypothetical protein AAFQ94_10205 [Bacteroidota bacterium]
MKKVTFFIAICFCIVLNTTAQKYPFIPDSLTLLPLKVLFENPPPANVDLVYYEDGTRTTFKEVFPLVMQRKLMPHMFVDKDGNYRALVVAKIDVGTTRQVTINYPDIPESLKNYGYSFGNPASDAVIIHTQIGPLTNLLTEEFKKIFTNVGGVDTSSYFVINIHQFQTMHPEKLSENEVSFEQAKNYNKVSTKMLYELASYFKSHEKTVYIVGLSFGAFAGIDCIAEYGPLVDGYLLMVGRLDMTETIWKSFSEGVEATFEEDAITVKIGQKPEKTSSINLNKIAAGYGFNRYSERLQDTDLSKLIYYFGKKDQSVGKLTESEIELLENNGATVVGFNGGHNQTLDYLREALQKLLQQ